MRTHTALTLILFLSLQLTWAAIGPYFAHGSQDNSDFSGHAQHFDHAVIGGDAEKAPAAANLDATDQGAGDAVTESLDTDCEKCHGHLNAVLLAQAENFKSFESGPHNDGLDEAARPHTSSRPERPQWRPLA